MSGLRKLLTDRLRNRRGAALVMIAIMMTVMVGMIGAAVDFARMYAFKAQVQVVADASALAGAIELVKGRNNANVPDTARRIALLNKVNGGDTAFVPRDSVQPVTWDFTNRTYTVSAWGNSNTNAVRVSAHYTAPYTFGQVFGATPSTLPGEAIAAVGYVGNTNCLKPWAVYYGELLQSLPPPTNTADPATYNLTATDVQNLAANQTPVTMQFDNSNPTAPGNIANVIVSDPWNGNNSYTNAINGACANLEIGPGTWLSSDPTEGSGTTTNAIRQLCGGNGNGQNAFACNVNVKLAVWDYNNGLSGANLQYHVKFVGVFKITYYDPGTGNSTVSRVTGYFTSMADPNGGSFSSTPGPLTGKAVLTL